jgi:PAS domain S-box-containing protein
LAQTLWFNSVTIFSDSLELINQIRRVFEAYFGENTVAVSPGDLRNPRLDTDLAIIDGDSTSMDTIHSLPIPLLQRSVLLYSDLSPDSLVRLHSEGQGEFCALGSLDKELILKLVKVQNSLMKDGEFFREILTLTNTGIFVVDYTEDGDFIYRYSNPANVKNTGIPAEAAIMKKVQDLEPFIGKEGVQSVTSLFSEVIREGVTKSFESPFTLEGKETWWINRLTPLKDATGRFYRIIGSAVDISERYKLETNLRKMNRIQNTIFSLLSHDVYSPVAINHHFAKELVRQIPTASKGDIQLGLSTISDSLEKASSLLEKLLDWGTSQLDKKEFLPKETNLEGLIRETALFYEDMANKKGVQIKLGIQHSHTVWADPNMISTIMRNLLANAIKFTKKGQSIEVNTQEQDDKVHITVKDEGIGMSDDKLAKIFSSDDTRIRRGTGGEKGFGLGLQICFEFIKYHQEQFTVSSKEGEGTIFHFQLPFFKP